MITRLILHNFQCHEDLTLELGRSNVLQGNSNSGKTAVLRALYWVLYNTPSGDSYVSYWAKAKTKFKADEYTSVIVEVDGHVIERKRSNDFNGYIVDGTVFEALRTSVPDEVTRIFNIADASVQRQMDAPFLLSSTPGEASQYLNSLAGLECVDDILSIAKRKVADTASQVESVAETSEAFEKEVLSYAWVPNAELLLEKVTSLEPAIDELTRKISSLRQSIRDYKAIRSYPEIPSWLVDGDKTSVIDDLQANLLTARKYAEACRNLSRIIPILDSLAILEKPRTPRYTDRDLNSIRRSIHEYIAAQSKCEHSTEVLFKVGTLPSPMPSRWEGKLDTLRVLNADYSKSISVFRKCSRALTSLESLTEPKAPILGEKEMGLLVRAIRAYKSLNVSILGLEKELDSAWQSIDGEVCPLCGQRINSRNHLK